MVFPPVTTLLALSSCSIQTVLEASVLELPPLLEEYWGTVSGKQGFSEWPVDQLGLHIVCSQMCVWVTTKLLS